MLFLNMTTLSVMKKSREEEYVSFSKCMPCAFSKPALKGSKYFLISLATELDL